MTEQMEGRRTFARLAWIAGWAMRSTTVGLGRAKQNGIIGVGLDMLLEILGTLEGLAAEIALVRL